MSTMKKLAPRWPLIVSYLGMITILMACAGGTTSSTSDQTLQIADGIVEVKNNDGDWVPVAGDATFELTGALENTDPWTVAGRTFETNESTQISEGLQVGDLVRVQGAILEDGTWVAYSIGPAEDQTDPVIILIGTVDSVDPWVVNGTELNVTDTTEIQGEITPGTVVRVEIILLEDGTWEVLSIAPLGTSTQTPDCATVIATVVSVEGNQVQFLGWPTIVILETDTSYTNNGEEPLRAGQVIQAVVCVSEGTLVIVNITVLDSDGSPSTGGEKVLVCHKPNNKKGGHTISISSSAVPAHLGHGDTMGPCP